METRPYISWELAENFMVDAFQAVGVPEADARICADVLLESDRRGIESHGCNRFKPIYMDRILNGTLKPVTEIEILKDTPTTVVMDAHDGMGMVASHKMMEMLIEKAKKYVDEHTDIIHFNGKFKPWKSDYKGELDGYWHHFDRMPSYKARRYYSETA